MWEYTQANGTMVGLQNLGSEGWQVYMEERSERGPIEAEVNEIPESQIIGLYQKLKDYFER